MIDFDFKELSPADVSEGGKNGSIPITLRSTLEVGEKSRLLN